MLSYNCKVFFYLFVNVVGIGVVLIEEDFWSLLELGVFVVVFVFGG